MHGKEEEKIKKVKTINVKIKSKNEQLNECDENL
jgi:hypothetical protein